MNQFLKSLGRVSRLLFLAFNSLWLGSACDGTDPGPDSTSKPPISAFVLPRPAGFPVPQIPADNPLTAEKIELGRHLFYERRLSITGSFACASCHFQDKAFTDGKPVGVGATGEAHPRNSMSLANVAYHSSLTWANPVLPNLEKQALVPMLGENPIELGLSGQEGRVLAELQALPLYQTLFAQAFPEEANPYTLENLTKALASFQRRMISGCSPYDRYKAGELQALSESAIRGESLFFSERLECDHCHGGFNFSENVTYEGKVFLEQQFHNTGLYNIDGKGGFPLGNTGLREITHRAEDMGKFKAPTLRNIAVTAPYMHDGSIATLEEVLDHYAAGGRTITSGPNAGMGRLNPYKSELIVGFTLSAEEKNDVVNFLKSLTDENFLRDPALSDPFQPASTPVSLESKCPLEPNPS